MSVRDMAAQTARDRRSDSTQAMVAEFHRKQRAYNADPGVITSHAPHVPPYEVIENRYNMLVEESRELDMEIMPWPGTPRDVVRIAHETADLVYVLYGLALECGFDLDACLAEVHRANITKDPACGEKAIKGADFVPPDIEGVLYPPTQYEIKRKAGYTDEQIRQQGGRAAP